MSVEKEDLEMLNKKFGNTKENPDNWDKIIVPVDCLTLQRILVLD